MYTFPNTCFSFIHIFLVNVGDDSPVFEGLFEYCGLSAGGSMGKEKKREGGKMKY